MRGTSQEEKEKGNRNIILRHPRLCSPYANYVLNTARGTDKGLWSAVGVVTKKRVCGVDYQSTEGGDQREDKKRSERLRSRPATRWSRTLKVTTQRQRQRRSGISTFTLNEQQTYPSGLLGLL